MLVRGATPRAGPRRGRTTRKRLTDSGPRGSAHSAQQRPQRGPTVRAGDSGRHRAAGGSASAAAHALCRRRRRLTARVPCYPHPTSVCWGHCGTFAGGPHPVAGGIVGSWPCPRRARAISPRGVGLARAGTLLWPSARRCLGGAPAIPLASAGRLGMALSRLGPRENAYGPPLRPAVGNLRTACFSLGSGPDPGRHRRP